MADVRHLTPQELAVARAYHREVDRVEKWMAQAEKAWMAEHGSEKGWDRYWRELNDGQSVRYDPGEAGHRAARRLWVDRVDEARPVEVRSSARASGVVPKEVFEAYDRAADEFYASRPDTAQFHGRLSHFAGLHAMEQERARVTEVARVAEVARAHTPEVSRSLGIER